MKIKHLKARAMIYSFLVGAPIPPDDECAKIVIAICEQRYYL